MQAASKEKIQELQGIISKMPLEVCCMTMLPEFGVRWREVSKFVRMSRLPMAPASVARVLCKHVAKNLPESDVVDIVARLRLILIATQEHKWHVVDLQEPIANETPIGDIISNIPLKITQAMKKTRAGRNMRPEVQTILLGDLLYISMQLVSDTKQGATLYAATPPGAPVVLVSSVTSGMLKGLVEGLGYKRHEDAQLFGRDPHSLLRIHNRNHTEIAEHLASIPEYNPTPIITAKGIDYTNKTYNEKYAEAILGPEPPLLTNLMITSSRPFFDPSRLNKNINITVQIKSEHIAKTLKTWVSKGSLAPTSDLFQIFHKIKSNKISFQNDDVMAD